MKIQDYKEATKRLSNFSAWVKDVTTDKAEEARRASVLVRFLMSLFAAKEQLIAELRKPKFPSGGIKSMHEMGNFWEEPKRGRLDGIEGIVKPIAF
jgi:hypothetical protein